jgi:hypothetical protein
MVGGRYRREAAIHEFAIFSVNRALKRSSLPLVVQTVVPGRNR